MPHLLISGARGKLQRRTIGEGELTIGRDDCDLVLPNVSVSRHHCTIKVQGATVTATDAGSQNGTLVNGAAIFETQLHTGDELGIGRYRLIFLDDGGPHQFYKGRYVARLPEYQIGGAVSARSPDSTFEMSFDEVQRLTRIRRMVDQARLVSLRAPDSFWHPEDKGLTFGGGDAMVLCDGKLMMGVVAEVTWDGNQHVLVRRSLVGKVLHNDKKVREQPLKNHDIVQIGKSIYRYECPEDGD